MIKREKINIPIFGLILALLSLAPLGMFSSLASILLLALGGGVIILFMHGSRFLSSTVILYVLSVVLLGMGLSSTAICAALFCALSATYILNSEKTPIFESIITVIAALIGFGVCYALLKDFSLALFTPSLLIVTLFVFISIKRGFARTAGIVFISVGIAIPVLASLGFALWSYKGSISPDAIREVLDEGRDALAGYIKESVSFMTKFVSAGGQSSSAVSEVFSDANIEELVTSIFNLIPAVSVILISVAAFFIQRLTYIFISVSGHGSRITREMGVFRVSAVTGFLFVIAVFVSFISSLLNGDNAQFVSLVSGNLYLILMPGLVGTGLVLLFAKIRAGKMRRPGIFTIILGVMTAVIMPSALILIVAYFGAICVIYEELIEFLKSKKNDDQ